MTGKLSETPLPLLSNNAIAELLESNVIQISSFDLTMLQSTSYRLRFASLRLQNVEDDGIELAEIMVDLNRSGSYSIQPGECVIASPNERIFLAEGLVGTFSPTSFCVRNRLVLLAGILDANYHDRLEFGLLNVGKVPFEVTPNQQLVRVSFSTLGSSNKPTYSGVPEGAKIAELEKLKSLENELKRLTDGVAAKIEATNHGGG